MRKIVTLFAVFVSGQLYAQTLTNGGKLKPEQAIMDIRHYTIALNVDFNQKSCGLNVYTYNKNLRRN